MGCTKRTPKIRLSLDVVGSEQVCLIGQRIVSMLFTIENIGNMEVWLACVHPLLAPQESGRGRLCVAVVNRVLSHDFYMDLWKRR